MRDPGRGLTREPGPAGWRRLGSDVARMLSSVGLERSARLVAIALVPVFLSADTIDRFVTLYTALIVYVLVTSFAPRNRFLRAADLAVSSALILATGGQVLPFLLFLAVTVAGPAASAGMLAGFAAGGTLTIVLMASLALTDRFAALSTVELITLALLFPLTGLTTGAASQVHADEQLRDRRMLQEANRLLSALRSIADEIPGGLDVTTVAAALIAETRALRGATGALVYALEDGVLKPVAADSVSLGALPSLRIDELRGLSHPGRARLHSRSMLPSSLASACEGHLWWTVAGMHRNDQLVGALLVSADGPDTARRSRPHVVHLASDGAVAMDNAMLFDGTRVRAARAARLQLAGDLHDGVAQALAHLRMELELMAMTSSEPDGGECARLARVARGALEDLRATVGGLRGGADASIAKEISRHIDHLRTARGPEIVFDHAGVTDLPAEQADELLRVVQEALSNALLHADASTIRIDLEIDDRVLRLVIEDDGVGPEGPSPRPGGGVGIRSMRERAHRLGGELTVRPRKGGGTVVDLCCPAAHVARNHRSTVDHLASSTPVPPDESPSGGRT